jgi:hypothetical protein
MYGFHTDDLAEMIGDSPFVGIQARIAYGEFEKWSRFMARSR